MGRKATCTTTLTMPEVPENPPLSGLWGTVWLGTALVAVLNAVVHFSPMRLLAYGFVEVTAGLVLVAILALWKGLDPEAAARMLTRNVVTFVRCCRRNIAQRRGLGDNLRYGLATAIMLAVLIWGVVGV